ncbi:MAG: hypothetical protein Q8K75_00215 [Chlamydiales bacterium]|nr:hypothetical protein [Chlamydiales bacterium]
MLLLLLVSSVYAEPSPVVVSKEDASYLVRVMGQQEQFTAVFPMEPTQLGDGTDGQIVYELDLEESYNVRYLFSYVYNTDKLGYPYSYLLNRPAKGGQAQEKVRKETVEVLIRRMLSLAGQGNGVIVMQRDEEQYPPGKGTLGGAYKYDIKVFDRDGNVTEVTFRAFMGQEGLYIIAMMGQGVHRHPDEGVYKIPLGDIRWQMWPFGYKPSWEAPNISPVALFFRDGKLRLPIIPRLWDKVTWGKYGPKPFFNNAKLSFTKE